MSRPSAALVISSATYSAYDPVTPAALTPAIATGLLRDELDFTGVAISDDVGSLTAATGGTAGEAAAAAIAAGVDLIQIPDPAEVEAAYRHVLTAKIPAARLREALYRVLTLKRSAGLLGKAGAE